MTLAERITVAPDQGRAALGDPSGAERFGYIWLFDLDLQVFWS